MTAKLARTITWNSSKQTYYTANLLVDRGMEDDCYRAYSYFRWADNVIDEECQTRSERMDFISRQIHLVSKLCDGLQIDDLSPEEELIADLIRHDGEGSCGLRSYVRNFLSILEFDARRKDRYINQEELTWYSDRLGIAVTDAIQHFIGHGHEYPEDERRYLAATAAHIVHMLRDMLDDIQEGYINIPSEYLSEQGVAPEDLQSLAALCEPVALRSFVKIQIDLARRYFALGKEYLDTLDVLRCKIAGHLYCLRFEGVMDTIENDGYILRSEYAERRKLGTFFKSVELVVSVSVCHVVQKIGRLFGNQNQSCELNPSS
ncbi:MAG: squalene/phytoene synthase family protein [Anaerolineales bacterium]|nr:squalene/phytoene synthase family protein [Chloroflexota bacterium]MBL6980899.1 squalene/phytoene synthase family protein [Anaerolineales bacterium]